MSNNERVIYVTSFNKELFDASGKNLLTTFNNCNIEGTLTIGYEGFELANYTADIFPEGKQLLCFDLDHDKILRDIFDKNRDVIPDYLGGNFISPCKCKKPWGKRLDAHGPNCVFTWWNRNFIRWFRKVVMCYNVQRFIKQHQLPFEYIIWIDSDCEFIDNLTEDKVAALFADNSVFYMRGNRTVIESGILGFNLKRRGDEIIERWLNAYTTQIFRDFERWDDGYVFETMMRGPFKKFNQLDLIPKNVSNLNDVAKNSILFPYIRHYKGLHGRKLGLMI